MSHILSALWRSTPTRNLFLKESIIGGQNYTQISKKLHTIGQLQKKPSHLFSLILSLPFWNHTLVCPSRIQTQNYFRYLPITSWTRLEYLCPICVEHRHIRKIGVFVLPF